MANEVRQLEDHLREALRRISTATVATILHRRGLRNQFVQGVARLAPVQETMVGQAFTLRHIPAREDIDVGAIFAEPDHPQRVAVDTIPAGHVLVLDCRRDATAASLGGILATRLEMRGCAGVVSDAGIRDADYASGLNMPVYVAGRSAPTNLTKHHAIDINVPIGCGGVAVYPGDVMLGDGDGVMVIPLEIVGEVVEDAQRMEHFEQFATELIRAGHPVIGVYPPNQTTAALYAQYSRQHPQGQGAV